MQGGMCVESKPGSAAFREGLNHEENKLTGENSWPFCIRVTK